MQPCSLCDEEVVGSGRRHVERVHLPWYFAPERACWTCKTSCSSQCFLRVEHLQREGHGEGSRFGTDEQLHNWVLWVTHLLHYFRGILDLGSLEELRRFVVAEGLAPRNVEFPPCREALLSLLDAHLGQWSPPVHIVAPPATVSALLHWRTMANLLKFVPSRVRQAFAHRQVLATYRGTVTEIPELPWEAVPCTYDAHCHLDKMLKIFGKASWDELLEALAGGFQLRGVVANFVFPNQWDKHRTFEDVPGVYFTFGVHPHARQQKWTVDELEGLLGHARCVALGEVGLTLPAEDKDQQLSLLRQQLPLAQKLRLPVVVHGQGPDSLQLVLEELSAILPRSHRLLIHCFDGNLELAHQFLARFPNTIFSIGGLIFKDKPALRQVTTALDLDRLVVETDAPFLPPPGTPPKRNHPWNVYQVVREVSVIKNVPPRIIIDATRRNVEWLFRL